jgi:hypothetical protein
MERQLSERLEHERLVAVAQVRNEAFERDHPGHSQWVQETIQAYGDVKPEIARAIYSSEYGPQIVSLICERAPEGIIAQLNQMPPREVDRMVAYLEGHLASQDWQRHVAPQRYEPPKPRMVSSAPKPVSTVAGRAHAASKSLEEMSYDEYAATRRAQIAAKQGR